MGGLLDMEDYAGYGVKWGHGEQARYGTLKELEEKILYKRVIEWNEDELVLEDGTRIEIKMSESDCCAYAGGKFNDVKLDAMITNIRISDPINIPDWDTRVRRVAVNLFHNRNHIANAQITADAGNGGYYYSVGSLVIGDVHFPVVDA